MELIDKIQNLWGKTLSPIETFTIINLLNEENIQEDVILEAAIMSVDKEKPMLYMKKILYNIKHPLESNNTNKNIQPSEPPKESGSQWLDNLKETLK